MIMGKKENQKKTEDREGTRVGEGRERGGMGGRVGERG